VTKAERLDALLARLEGLPARISSLTVGIGHLRARRGEKDDDTWSVLQSLQLKARALGDELFELWLEIGRVTADGSGPRLGRRVDPDELRQQLRGAVVNTDRRS